MCKNCDKTYGSRAMLMQHQMEHFSDHASDADESDSDHDMTGVEHVIQRAS